MSVEIIAAAIGAFATIVAALIGLLKLRSRHNAVQSIEEPTYGWRTNRRTLEQPQVDHSADLQALHAEIEYRKHPETEVKTLGRKT
jgi:hypothetical protein